ncbi:MAG: SusC/RagA family TonB-linked outer membrane protein [Catalinimonas sp.]
MRKFLLLAGLTLMSVMAYAQTQRITGVVTGVSDKQPLPGVNVTVTGTTTGTITDVNGRYSLEVPTGAESLTFSYVGFESMEQAINGRATVDVKLREDVQQLGEVVVTAVGIETSKRSLGYSIQEVDGEELAQAQETNVVNALQGQVAGVNIISSSGAPGASAAIRIRGNTSILGNNSPLFVVDGVPIDNSETGEGTDGVDQSNRAIDLNPEDIENLTVLKGPAATVLYGIRAAGGAVIITTKKGKRDTRPQVTFSTSAEINEVNKFPELQQEFAQGSPRGGVATYRGPETFEGFSWGPRISDLRYDGDPDYPYSRFGALVPASENPEGRAAQGYNAADAFFVNGFTTDNNVSVRGGTERTSYYFSGGYLNQSGIIPESSFERISLRTTLSTDLTDKLTASISANYVNSGGRRMERGSNLRGIMLGLVRNTPTFDVGDGLTGRDAAAEPSTYELPDGTQRSYRAGIYDNPFWVVNNNYTTDNVNRIIGYTSLNYEVLPWMTFSYKLGLDTYAEERLGHIDIVPNWNPGLVQNDNINSTNINSDFLVLMSHEFGPNFEVTATLGHNYFSNMTDRRLTTGNGLSQPDFFNIANASSAVSSNPISKRKVHGVFGDVKVGFRNQLFLNLSGRNDWSSTLPDDDNSFFYPAVSLGWVPTETFNVNSAILSYAKLRASYGQVGNDAPLYATTSYFEQAQATGDGFISPDNGIVFPFLGQNAFEQDGILGNNQLRAELTTTWEVGADVRFLNNRLGLDLTYYDSETTDQIIPVQISAASGFLQVVRNAGRVSNRGIEAVLTGTPVKTSSFTWDITANFTTFENIVEELAPGLDNVFLAGFTSTSSRAVAGEPFGALYGTVFQRAPDGQLIIGNDGFPLTEADPQAVGNPLPDWLLGIRNGFNYKGIGFSFLVDIRQGGDVWNGTRGVAEYFGVTQRTADERELTGVVIDGVVNTGTAAEPNYVPNQKQVDFANPAQGLGSYRWVRYGFGTISEENIEDASWVRLREARLSYTLPGTLLGGTFSNVNLSLFGRNLLLFTPYTGVDPETNLTGTSNGFGLDYFNNPNVRSYGATLRFSL